MAASIPRAACASFLSCFPADTSAGHLFPVTVHLCQVNVPPQGRVGPAQSYVGPGAGYVTCGTQRDYCKAGRVAGRVWYEQRAQKNRAPSTGRRKEESWGQGPTLSLTNWFSSPQSESKDTSFSQGQELGSRYEVTFTGGCDCDESPQSPCVCDLSFCVTAL